MSYEHKPMSGSLFKNTKKINETQPDYRGDGVVNGKDVWIAGWINKKKDGETYLNIKFEEKEAKQPQEAPPSQGEPVDVNKAIPF